MALPLNSKHGYSLIMAMTLFFLHVVSFPLAGEDMQELVSALHNEIRSLRRSSKDSDINQVRALLEKGANPNSLYDTDTGETLLMQVMSERYLIDKVKLRLVELLLEYGADLNARDNKGQSAIYYLDCDNSYSEFIDFLVSKGIRFDITDNKGVSPCMYYGDGKSEKSILILDWEEKYSPGFTAGYKSRNDYLTAILLKLSQGSHTVIRNFEYTASNMAIRLLEAGVDLSLLLNPGGNTTLIKRIINTDEVQFIEKLLRFGLAPGAVDADGIPFVMWAPVSDKFKAITLLIEKGAPVNGIDAKGNTLLFSAVASHNKNNNELVRFLLLHGANPNIQNKQGETALMKVDSLSLYEETVINTLLEFGADPNIQDRNGKTALMHLGYNHSWLSLRDGVDPTIKDTRGRDALFYCRELNADMVEYFISRGCHIDAQDAHGDTPLTLAALLGREKAILALLDRGANPNIPDHHGRSALHLYLLSLEREKYHSTDQPPWGKTPETVVSAFLAAGAQPALKDDEGDSALIYILFISREYRDMQIFRDQMLRYASADEIKTDKTAARKMRAKERRDDFVYSEYFMPAMGLLGFSLLDGGISVGMREGVYKGREMENWMGPTNAVLAMGSAGLLMGSLIGLGDRRGLDRIITFLFGGILGLVGGLAVGSLPGVQNAFNESPALYYAPAALSALTASMLIIKIRLE